MIDIHTHFAYKDFFSSEFIEGVAENTYDMIDEEMKKSVKQEFFKKVVSNNLLDKDCSKLIKQMNSAGIDKSVLLIVDYYYDNSEHNISLEEIFAKHYEISQKWSDRFMIFSGVDPRRGKQGLDLFEKSIVEYNFKGLKLYPPCGFELDDKELYPYYEICQKHNVPVLSHIGPSIKSMKNNSNYPKSIMNVAKEFKGVNFILGHAGMLYFDESFPICKENSNVYMDVSGFQLMRDSKSLIENRMTQIFNSTPEQILFGTDWPMFNLKGTQKSWVEYFMKIKTISSNNLDLFFEKNGLKALGKLK
jgi:predicted TIM-barrel fold metal-dependent hydrolase